MDNKVGGSVTHKQTSLKINKQKIPQAERKTEVRAQVICARLAISMLSYGQIIKD